MKTRGGFESAAAGQFVARSGYTAQAKRLAFLSTIPSTGRALRKLDRVQKPESKVRVWSWSLDPIDSIDSYR